jgi:hypothetical protein
VNVRSLVAALLLTVSGALPSEAAYTFIFNAGPPPGPGGERGGVNYQGPNNVSGAINTSGPFFGIFGVGTPLNSGRTISELGVSFQVFGGFCWRIPPGRPEPEDSAYLGEPSCPDSG